MTTVEDLAAQITRLEATVGALTGKVNLLGGGSVAAGQVCSASRPHAGKLIFQRGPNNYVCEVDGNVFVKDGAGGLREA